MALTPNPDPDTVVYEMQISVGAVAGLVVAEYGDPINSTVTFPPEHAIAFAQALTRAAERAKAHKASTPN